MNYILDTHVLIWALSEPTKLNQHEKKIITDTGNHFLIPTVVMLEIGFLNEIKRIDFDMDEVTTAINKNSKMDFLSFDELAMLNSLKLSGNRDPFDRMILGHALAAATKIITRDKWMIKSAPHLLA